jgi:hypothetical protein
LWNEHVEHRPVQETDVIGHEDVGRAIVDPSAPPDTELDAADFLPEADRPFPHGHQRAMSLGQVTKDEERNECCSQDDVDKEQKKSPHEPSRL